MEATLDLPTPEATFAFGERLGRLLRPGDFVGLTGNLGAGKTLLVRGVAKSLGLLPGQVQSPTFTLINTYQGAAFPLHHADLYRLDQEDELYATGYFDLLEGEGALIVEWASRIAAASPRERLEAHLDRITDTSRVLRLTAHGARPQELLRALGVAVVG